MLGKEKKQNPPSRLWPARRRSRSTLGEDQRSGAQERKWRASLALRASLRRAEFEETAIRVGYVPSVPDGLGHPAERSRGRISRLNQKAK